MHAGTFSLTDSISWRCRNVTLRVSTAIVESCLRGIRNVNHTNDEFVLLYFCFTCKHNHRIHTRYNNPLTTRCLVSKMCCQQTIDARFGDLNHKDEHK